MPLSPKNFRKVSDSAAVGTSLNVRLYTSGSLAAILSVNSRQYPTRCALLSNPIGCYPGLPEFARWRLSPKPFRSMSR